MKRATDTADFVASPIGRYVVGRSYVGWCAARDLVGCTQWGVPEEQDIHEMLELMNIVRHPDLAPSGCVLMDCRYVERVAPDVLMLFVERARALLPRWAPRIARQAVVIPDGLGGLLLAAPLPLLAPIYPFRFAVDLDAALAFLDHSAARAAHAEIDEIVRSMRGLPTLLIRLRGVLARDLAGATLASCASALATSSRSLQRELRDLQTSFSTELRRARVDAAAELLQLSDAKIDAIAARVGFGTASRMNAALRRDLGVTAKDLRTQKLRASATAR